MGYIIRILNNPFMVAFIWIVIGILVNTAPPHLPSTSGQFGVGFLLHDWAQYIISVAFWPLSFVHPALTTGKWTQSGF